MGESVRFRRSVVATWMLVNLALASSPVATESAGGRATGSTTLSSGMDDSNVHLCRGIPRDDPGLIMWPAVEVGHATLGSGWGGGLNSPTTYTVTPSGTVAVASQGQANGGITKDRYVESGTAPSFGASGASIAVPVKIGLSLDGYYEGLLGDERFGFFSVGGNATVPTPSPHWRLGVWHVRGGAEHHTLGDGNAPSLGDTKVVIPAGVGFGG